MAYTNPSVADFKNQFFRDFPYGTDLNTTVLDQDITSAFVLTNININQGLFAAQGFYSYGYNLMSAHFLVTNLRSSSQGRNGKFTWLENSKSVGDLAAQFSIPQRVLDNPYWSMLCTTNYGALFLQTVLPQLCGQVFIAYGDTLP